MPLSLDELVAEVSEPVVVNVGTDDAPRTITIRFRPGAMTPELEARIHRVSMTAQIGAVYQTMLAEILTEWDVTGTLPPIAHEEPLDDGETARERKERERINKEIEAENERRAVVHNLPVTSETLNLIPIKYLEKIVEAVNDAQRPKKTIPVGSRTSFGRGAAPSRTGTA